MLSRNEVAKFLLDEYDEALAKKAKANVEVRKANKSLGMSLDNAFRRCTSTALPWFMPIRRVVPLSSDQTRKFMIVDDGAGGRVNRSCVKDKNADAPEPRWYELEDEDDETGQLTFVWKKFIVAANFFIETMFMLNCV